MGLTMLAIPALLTQFLLQQRGVWQIDLLLLGLAASLLDRKPCWQVAVWAVARETFGDAEPGVYLIAAGAWRIFLSRRRGGGPTSPVLRALGRGGGLLGVQATVWFLSGLGAGGADWGSWEALLQRTLVMTTMVGAWYWALDGDGICPNTG